MQTRELNNTRKFKTAHFRIRKYTVKTDTAVKVTYGRYKYSGS